MRNVMSWIKNVSTILFATLIALMCAEIFLRIFGVGYGNSPLERSRTYHHVHPSNYQFLMHDPNEEYGGYQVYYDELGFRVRDNSSQISELLSVEEAVIFLGDSFTEGNQVDYDETFVSLVSEQLQVPTINLGVSSYSPLIYALQVENIVSQFEANSVVLQIFSNDFSGDKGYLQQSILEQNKIIGVDGGDNSILISIARNSYLIRFLRKSQLILKSILSSPKASSVIPTSAFDYEQNVTDEELYNTVNIIQHIDLALAQQNKRLYVFLIPSKSLSLSGNCCDEDILYERFYSALSELGIETVDVKPLFEQSENQRELFFIKDIHLTSEGHQVVAASISNHLTGD